MVPVHRLSSKLDSIASFDLESAGPSYMESTEYPAVESLTNVVIDDNVHVNDNAIDPTHEEENPYSSSDDDEVSADVADAHADTFDVGANAFTAPASVIEDEKVCLSVCIPNTTNTTPAGVCSISIRLHGYNIF